MACVFLTPASISQLTDKCKVFLSSLQIEIVDEILTSTDGGGINFSTRYRNLEADPAPRIYQVTVSGGAGCDCPKILLYAGTDYTIDLPSGDITTAAPTTNTLLIDYFFQPISDVELEEMLQCTIAEVAVLLHRVINSAAVVEEYQTLICKKLYSNVVSHLVLEARNYFTLSADGISLSKDQIVGHLTAIKDSIEKDILMLINQNRYWNKTQRFE